MRYLLLLLFGLLQLTSCMDSKQNKPVVTEESTTSVEEVADSTLQKTLESLGVKDQTLRLILPEVTNKFGNGSEEVKYFWSLIHEQDSINEAETVSILENYGWLGKSRIGDEANQALWLVIQHAPLEAQERYLPLLRKSVDENESEGWHLAFLEDRILMRNDKKQIYGTQAKWDADLAKMRIHDIEDIKNVNERRKQLGLETVEEYAETNGYVFDQ